ETDNGGYVGIIDDIVNENKQVVTFENFGKRGNRSDQMLERMEYPDIDDALKDADIILMTIGANDIMKILRDNITDLQIEAFKDERINYEKRLRDIFDGMVDRNDQADIYLIGFYNPFKQFITVREMDNIVNEWNKTGVDLSEELDQKDIYMCFISLSNNTYRARNWIPLSMRGTRRARIWPRNMIK